MTPILARSATTLIAAALIAFGGAGAAWAQADGAAPADPVLPGGAAASPPQEQRLLPGSGPGAALMNDLQARMKQIQATSDPVLRRQRSDEFLKTLQQGMARISQQPVAGAAR